MLTLLGCNHRSAPIALRERLSFPTEALAETVERLRARPGVREAFVLSTCNRVELLVRTPSGAEGDPLDVVRAFLVDERGVDAETLDAHTYHHRGDDAVRHLFEVAAGMDSMILGEPQIFGQLKAALTAARRGGGIGKVLGRLFQQCLTTTKRVRTETGIGRHAVSVGLAAAQLAGQIFGELTGRRVLVVGAGKMAQLVATHLGAGGAAPIVVCSRTYNRAATVAARFDGRAVPWDELEHGLADADIVVTCTGSTRPVVGCAEVERALRRRRGTPLLVVDIAVPRDVDPEVGRLDGVYLYDIDGLQEIVDFSLDERRRAAAEAREEIERDAAAFARWRREQGLTPAIVALRRRFETVALEHVTRYAAGADEAARAALARSLSRKLIHGPLVELRRAAAEGRAVELVALYSRIFDLEPLAEPLAEPRPAGDAEPAAETEPDRPARERRGGIRGVVRGGRTD